MFAFKGPAQPSRWPTRSTQVTTIWKSDVSVATPIRPSPWTPCGGRKATPVHELERYLRCKDCSQVRGLATNAAIDLVGLKIAPSRRKQGRVDANLRSSFSHVADRVLAFGRAAILHIDKDRRAIVQSVLSK